MELPNHAKQLLLQLNQQRAKGFLCDVIIVVENALFRAHKNILAASSIYFKSLVLHDNLINLDTEMVNPSVFRQVLDFIYTGKLLSSSDQSSEQNFSALLTAASYLQLNDLAALCRKKLKRNGGKPLPDEGLRDKLSDDEMFVGSSGKNGNGVSGGSNGNLSSGASAGEPDHGLDLSKKSPPSAGTTSDALSPHSNSQESPQSASVSTTNSASLDDSSTTLPGLDACVPEPTELTPNPKAPEQTQTPDGPPPNKKSRQVSRKKEWPKKDASGLKSEDHERPLVNGVIVGPKETRSSNSGVGAGSGSSFASEQSFLCKKEDDGGENGPGPHATHSRGNSGRALPQLRQLNGHRRQLTPEGPSSSSKQEAATTYVKEEDEDEAEDLSAPVGPSNFGGTETRPFRPHWSVKASGLCCKV
ncbi:hypothetical protein CRUP_036365 [Coryphaenoides rupestris]|nr:hypothetical protein CRUP_036365 [Coryphaenoides rupestris]